MDKILALLERISPVLIQYPPPVQWLFVASLASVLGSVLAFAIGYPNAASKRDGMTRDGALPELIKMARKPRAGSDVARYIIESVVMNVRITSRPRSIGSVKQTGEADTRITYTVFALEDVAPNEFDEFAHTNVKGAFVAWLPGSENETVSENGPGSKSWTIGAPIPKGGRRTFTTAFRYVYPLDFEDKRQVHDFTLDPASDAFCYPNSKDVIGELTIRVEADVPLEAPEEGDAILNDLAEKRMTRSAPAILVGGSEGFHQHVVVGRWQNVVPKQTAELRIRRKT